MLDRRELVIKKNISDASVPRQEQKVAAEGQNLRRVDEAAGLPGSVNERKGTGLHETKTGNGGY